MLTLNVLIAVSLAYVLLLFGLFIEFLKAGSTLLLATRDTKLSGHRL